MRCVLIPVIAGLLHLENAFIQGHAFQNNRLQDVFGRAAPVPNAGLFRRMAPKRKAAPISSSQSQSSSSYSGTSSSSSKSESSWDPDRKKPRTESSLPSSTLSDAAISERLSGGRSARADGLAAGRSDTGLSSLRTTPAQLKGARDSTARTAKAKALSLNSKDVDLGAKKDGRGSNKYWATMTEEQKAERNALRREQVAGMTSQEKQLLAKKTKEQRAADPERFKAYEAKKRQKRKEKLASSGAQDEAKAKQYSMQLKWKANLSDEKKAELKEKHRLYNLEWKAKARANRPAKVLPKLTEAQERRRAHKRAYQLEYNRKHRAKKVDTVPAGSSEGETLLKSQTKANNQAITKGVGIKKKVAKAGNPSHKVLTEAEKRNQRTAQRQNAQAKLKSNPIGQLPNAVNLEENRIKNGEGKHEYKAKLKTKEGEDNPNPNPPKPASQKSAQYELQKQLRAYQEGTAAPDYHRLQRIYKKGSVEEYMQPSNTGKGSAAAESPGMKQKLQVAKIPEKAQDIGSGERDKAVPEIQTDERLETSKTSNSNSVQRPPHQTPASSSIAKQPDREETLPQQIAGQPSISKHRLQASNAEPLKADSDNQIKAPRRSGRIASLVTPKRHPKQDNPVKPVQTTSTSQTAPEQQSRANSLPQTTPEKPESIGPGSSSHQSAKQSQRSGSPAPNVPSSPARSSSPPPRQLSPAPNSPDRSPSLGAWDPPVRSQSASPVPFMDFLPESPRWPPPWLDLLEENPWSSSSK